MEESQPAFPLENIERRLRDVARSEVPALEQALEYLIAAGGKRIRPRFALVIGDLLQCSAEVAETFGVVAELVHTASLLHDDVIDRSELRRGRPTVHVRFGVKTAVLAGDYLLSKGMHMLTEHGYFTAVREMSTAFSELVEAELLQSANAYSSDASVEDSRGIARGKTGSLFAWCARAPALTLKLAPEKVALADELGRMVGYAFQVADDLLDFSRVDTGKPTHKDLREGQLTIPMQLAMVEDESLEASVRQAFQSRQEADYGAAYDRLVASRAVILGQDELSRARRRVLELSEALGGGTEEVTAFFDRWISHRP
jgi:geranylgeranyl pyrophosphate synthase